MKLSFIHQQSNLLNKFKAKTKYQPNSTISISEKSQIIQLESDNLFSDIGINLDILILKASFKSRSKLYKLFRYDLVCQLWSIEALVAQLA